MFNSADFEYLYQQPYDILQQNNHDLMIHSRITDHEWIVVSNYESPDCYILHRHSRRYAFHRQRGSYKDLKEALCYIANHDEWFSNNKSKER